jgi:HPt (histidine-containing phosphotransfer) domain-containing protein
MTARQAPTTALDGELARLWATHRAEVDTRLATIDAAVAQCDEGALDDESRAAATRAAHQLAGTAGTFGFAAASEHAAALEQRLANPPDAVGAPAIAPLMTALRAALDHPASMDRS